MKKWHIFSISISNYQIHFYYCRWPYILLQNFHCLFYLRSSLIKFHQQWRFPIVQEAETLFRCFNNEPQTCLPKSTLLDSSNPTLLPMLEKWDFIQSVAQPLNFFDSLKTYEKLCRNCFDRNSPLNSFQTSYEGFTVSLGTFILLISYVEFWKTFPHKRCEMEIRTTPTGAMNQKYILHNNAVPTVTNIEMKCTLKYR
jgi:hypothetical protein